MPFGGGKSKNVMECTRFAVRKTDIDFRYKIGRYRQIQRVSMIAESENTIEPEDL